MSSEKTLTKGVAFNHFQGDRYRYLWQEPQWKKKTQLPPSSQSCIWEEKKRKVLLLFPGINGVATFSWIHKKKHGQQVKAGDSTPLLRSCDYLHPALGSPAQEGQGPVGMGSEGTQKMIRSTEQPSHQNWLRELALFSLKKTRLQGNLIKAFKYFKGVNKKDGNKAFEWAC